MLVWVDPPPAVELNVVLQSSMIRPYRAAKWE